MARSRSARKPGIEARQPRPSPYQHAGFHGKRAERPQFSYLAPISGDSQALATLHAVDDISPVVAQVPDRNLAYRRGVSPVRRLAGDNRPLSLRAVPKSCPNAVARGVLERLIVARTGSSEIKKDVSRRAQGAPSEVVPPAT
jgi:hypothetical protein